MSTRRRQVALMAVAFGALIDGCGAAGTIDAVGTCPGWDPTHYDANGDLDSCHLHDPPKCAGECAPEPPINWQGPVLVWMGKLGAVPACPARAPQLFDEGYADLSAPNECASCSCEAPTGACGLPETITASAAICGSVGQMTAFDPPKPWDGSCTAIGAIAAHAMCNGVPCVRSFTTGPLTISGDTCAVAMSTIPESLPVTWGSYVLACGGMASPPCTDPGDVCVPAVAPPSDGFHQCVIQDGDDLTCPSTYPWQLVVYYQSFEDTRSCSACTCGPAIGSDCTGTVSLYTDGHCSQPIPSGVLIDSTSSECDELPAGTALGSKSATAPTYQPGTCEPLGGEPSGTATPAIPRTVCCRASR